MAMAVIGGISALVLHAVETGQVQRLRQRAMPAEQPVRAVIREHG